MTLPFSPSQIQLRLRNLEHIDTDGACRFLPLSDQPRSRRMAPRCSSIELNETRGRKGLKRAKRAKRARPEDLCRQMCSKACERYAPPFSIDLPDIVDLAPLPHRRRIDTGALRRNVWRHEVGVGGIL